MANYMPIKKQEIFRVPNSSYPIIEKKPAAVVPAEPVVAVQPEVK